LTRTGQRAADKGHERVRDLETRWHVGSRSRLAVTLAVIVFGAVAAFVWVLQSGDPDEASGPAAVPGSSGLGANGAAGATVPGVAAKLVTVSRLRGIAGRESRPVYWAGPRPGSRIEYTQTRDGTTYVRYLTGSAKAGARGAGYIVIVTYTQPDAYRRVKRIAQAQHMFVADLPGGGIAVTRPNRPQNIHLVYPGRPYQVEAYAPRASQTRALVFGGAIRPIR
jgi:hypothetical protein